MKAFQLAASLLLFTSSAFAHVAYKGEVMPTTTIPYNWTGYYAGLNLGVVKHTMNITDTNASSFDATIQQTLNPKVTGGFQVGYRHQLDCARTSGVYGLEFSANFANAKSDKEYGSPFSLYELDSSNTLKNALLLQLIGGIAADRTLFFLTAGLSWTNITGNVTSLDGIPFFREFNVTKKQFGAVLGGGLEYAITNNISARFKVDVICANTYTTHDNIGDAFEISNNIVQTTVGLNYNFG